LFQARRGDFADACGEKGSRPNNLGPSLSQYLDLQSVTVERRNACIRRKQDLWRRRSSRQNHWHDGDPSRFRQGLGQTTHAEENDLQVEMAAFGQVVNGRHV